MFRYLRIQVLLLICLLLGGIGAQTEGIVSGVAIGSVDGIMNLGASGGGGGAAPTVTGVSPAVGVFAGGTSVTVTGTGFTGMTATNFGAANPGTCSVTNSTTITCASPSGSFGTVDVTVVTPNGTSPTSAVDNYSYYTGPGDIASYKVWGSPAFAYTAAYAATNGPLLDIVDTSTGAASCTLSVATNGAANTSAIVCPTGSPTVSVTTFCTVTHATGCSIAKTYDQSGGSSHWVQATLANMPLLNLSGISSRPSVQCISSSSTIMTTSATVASGANPWSYVGVAERTANFTTTQSFIGSQGGAGANNQLGFNNAAATALIFGPLVTLSSVADSAPHKMSGSFAPTSTLNVDGASASGGAGNNAFISTAINLCSFSPGSNFFTGLVGEAGLVPGTYNATIYANAGIRWGF